MGLFSVSAFVFLLGVLSTGANNTATRCPADQIVQCAAHPCAAVFCGPGHTCVADYCGNCVGRCEPVPGSCVYDGKTFADGASFLDTDGCNSCGCTKGSVSCTEKACLDTCDYGGEVYQAGESFPSTDGCNQCTCIAGGSVGCTKVYCPCTPQKPFVYCLIDPCTYTDCAPGSKCVSNYCGGCNAECKPVPGSCVYDGKTFADGASFPDTDGCNTCGCTKGSVSCTEKACLTQCEYGGKTYNVGEGFPAGDGCNRCSCRKDGHVICTLIACEPECPKYKCKACPNGYKKDHNGCQTCECLPETCGSKLCKSEEFCSGTECCPNWVKYARCSNPCIAKQKQCNVFQRCQSYCGCLARCVWRFPKTIY